MLDYRCRRTDTPSATALLTLVEGRVTRAGTPPMYHILQLPIIGTFHWYIIGTFGTFGTFWYILVHFGTFLREGCTMLQKWVYFPKSV